MRDDSRRLVLFDIDGTLISTGGLAGRVIAGAIEVTLGVRPPLDRFEFAGKTDPRIVLELAELAGLPPAQAQARLDEVFARYLEVLPSHLTPATVRVLPGVRETLDRLRDRDDVVVGLLTGNVAGGAAIKLGAAGLGDYFQLGAFGSDDADRNRLVPVARRRARERFGDGFAGDRTIVVGDAEADIRCARAGCARAVAVATGKTHRDRLAALRPDALLDSLAAELALPAILGSG